MIRLLQPFLDKLEAHTVLSREERQAVLDLGCCSERLEAQKHVALWGDTTVSACMVLDGICGRIGEPNEDKQQCTAIYLRGDVPDLYSLYQPRAAASVVALTPATIVRIPHVNLAALLKAYPVLGEAFTRYLVADAAIAFQWLLNVGGREAMSRAAHFFCETAVRMQMQADACSYYLPLSQVQLSEIFGLSVVHTNRVLMGLRRDNLVRLEKGMVQILDWKRLQSLGAFEDHYLRPQRRVPLAMQPVSSTGGGA